MSETKASTKTEPFVLFELSGSTYAIPSRNVRNLEMYQEVTLVPNANPAIDGVVFSRGQVIPAMNLRVRFGFPREKATMRTRIIFATLHDRTVGLIVDASREYRSISNESIRPIEETLIGIDGRYLKAVTKIGERLVLILDLEAALNVSDVQLPPDAVNIAPQTANP